MDIVKKLTGKNSKDYEFAATQIIDNVDVEAFKHLVEQDDFLFDFIKVNVAKRLEKACNSSNFKNLVKFLKYYSPFYAEFIAKTLAKFADEDLTDELLELLNNGTNEEKAYCAKYFSYIHDTLSLEFLRVYAYAEYKPLATNAAEALSAMNDLNSYEAAVKKLKSDDEFEKIVAIDFLTNYQDKRALPLIFDTMKNSIMSEHIASSIPYITPFWELLNSDEFKDDTLLAINYILNGLGEIVAISQIFDFQFYEIFSMLINAEATEKSAVILLNARNKFNLLTENEEYIYDEDTNTKNEVFEIKNLLTNADLSEFENKITEALNENSDFVFTALDLTTDINAIRQLLTAKNPTIIMKSLDSLKRLSNLTQEDKNTALKNINDTTMKTIIKAM